jgi:hypothetical protein
MLATRRCAEASVAGFRRAKANLARSTTAVRPRIARARLRVPGLEFQRSD